MDLIREAQQTIIEEDVSYDMVLENVNYLKQKSELIKDMPVAFIVETSMKALSNIANELSDTKKISNVEDAVDIVTLLTVLKDPEWREALSTDISRQQFYFIVNKLADDERVLKFVKAESRHPSLRGIKKKVEEMLINTNTPEGARHAYQELQKLRMLYDKIHTRINRNVNQEQRPEKSD